MSKRWISIGPFKRIASYDPEKNESPFVVEQAPMGRLLSVLSGGRIDFLDPNNLGYMDEEAVQSLITTSLEGYATQTWVTGEITTATNDMATQTWVTGQIATATNDMATQTWTTGQITTATDDMATQTWVTAQIEGLGNIGGAIAAGQVAFGTAADTIGGDNNLTWDDTNKRLGIGTSSPSALLDLNKTDLADGQDLIVLDAHRKYSIRRRGDTAGTADLTFKSHTGSNDFRFEGSSDNTVMHIGENGRVAIGGLGPTKTLDVLTPTDNTLGIKVKWAMIPTTPSYTGIGFGHNAKAAILFNRTAGNERGNLHFAISDSNDTIEANHGNSVLSIMGDGKVGIGTTSPSNNLEVYGSGWVSAGIRSTTSGATLVLRNEHRNYNIASRENQLQILDITDGSTRRLVINSVGNVGINTTSPDYTLDVNGTIQGTNLRGAGANITALNASNLSSGTVPDNRLNKTIGGDQYDPRYPVGGWRSTLSTPSLAQMGLDFSPFIENKMQFHTPDTVEYTTDGGTTWSDAMGTTTFTELNLKRIMAGRYIAGELQIPSPDEGGWDAMRMRFTADDYVFLNALYMYFTTQGHQIKIEIERYDNATSAWVDVVESGWFSGWPTHFWMTHSPIFFVDSLTSPRSKHVRVTIWTNYTGSTSNRIRFQQLNWYGTYPAADHSKVWDWNEDGDMRVRNNLTVDGQVRIDSSVSGPQMLIDRIGGQPTIKSTDNYLMIDSAGAAIGLNWYVSDNVILCAGGGKVGIGTHSPDYKLDVNGNARVQNNLTVDGTINIGALPAGSARQLLGTVGSTVGWRTPHRKAVLLMAQSGTPVARSGGAEEKPCISAANDEWTSGVWYLEFPKLNSDNFTAQWVFHVPDDAIGNQEVEVTVYWSFIDGFETWNRTIALDLGAYSIGVGDGLNWAGGYTAQNITVTGGTPNHNLYYTTFTHTNLAFSPGRTMIYRLTRKSGSPDTFEGPMYLIGMKLEYLYGPYS